MNRREVDSGTVDQIINSLTKIFALLVPKVVHDFQKRPAGLVGFPARFVRRHAGHETLDPSPIVLEPFAKRCNVHGHNLQRNYSGGKPSYRTRPQISGRFVITDVTPRPTKRRASAASSTVQACTS